MIFFNQNTPGAHSTILEIPFLFKLTHIIYFHLLLNAVCFVLLWALCQ